MYQIMETESANIRFCVDCVNDGQTAATHSGSRGSTTAVGLGPATNPCRQALVVPPYKEITPKNTMSLKSKCVKRPYLWLYILVPSLKGKNTTIIDL